MRLREDAHLWATTLFDELVALGYPRSYLIFVHQIRRRSRMPRCAERGRKPDRDELRGSRASSTSSGLRRWQRVV